jgi:hypothetical protein
MAELVAKNSIGTVVPPGDVSALADAIIVMANNRSSSKHNPAFNALREMFYWAQVTRPLKNFCLQPSFAADRGQYLTDVERISADKDAFLEQVVQDKDKFLEQVIQDKDKFLGQVIQDKDHFLQQVALEKDQIIFDQQNEIQDLKDELESIALHNQKLQGQLDKYHKTIPFRTYLWFKRAFQRNG